MVAASAVVAPTAASAVGVTYGTITLSPAGPYLPGDQVTVTASGMANQAPPPLADPTGAPNNGGGLLAAICVGNGNPQVGPSSCTTPAQPSTGAAPLASYGFGVPPSQDSFSATLSIPNNTTNYFPDYPTYICGNGAANQCLIGISDFRGNGPTQIPITYAYGSLTITPAGPYVNGQSVTMNYTGLVSPSAVTQTVEVGRTESVSVGLTHNLVRAPARLQRVDLTSSVEPPVPTQFRSSRVPLASLTTRVTPAEMVPVTSATSPSLTSGARDPSRFRSLSLRRQQCPQVRRCRVLLEWGTR